MSKHIEATYDITFRCTSSQLGTVMDTMKDFAFLVGVTQHTPPGNEGPQEIRGTLTPINAPRYVGGMRKKSISGPDLIKEIMADGKPHSLEEIGTTFIKRGFARTSGAASANLAMRQGLIHRLSNGDFIKTPA